MYNTTTTETTKPENFWCDFSCLLKTLVLIAVQCRNFSNELQWWNCLIECLEECEWMSEWLCVRDRERESGKEKEMKRIRWAIVLIECVLKFCLYVYIYFNCTLFEGNEIITFHKKTTSSMPFYEKSFVIFQWVNPWIEIEYWPKIVNSVLLCIYMILHPPRSIWIVIKRRFILPSSKWDAFKSCVFVLFYCFFLLHTTLYFMYSVLSSQIIA